MSKLLIIQFQAAPYLGVAYIAGALKANGHACEVILAGGLGEDEILGRVQAAEADLIGYTCMTGIHNFALDLAGRLKKSGVTTPMFYGGPHPTLFPDDMIHRPEVDGLSLGEGELPLVELMNTVDEAKAAGQKLFSGAGSFFRRPLPGFWFKFKNDGGEPEIIKNDLPPLPPLDDLPPVDWTCYEGTNILQTSPVVMPVRGCPYSCTYCFNHGTREMFKGKGQYIRHHSPERTLAEVKNAMAAFQPDPVIFQSDTMGIDLKWAREFFDLYKKEIARPFVILLRPELATDEFIDLLAEQGCHAVSLGVESGSERVRYEVLNRKYSNELLLKVADRLHKAGILFRTYNIIAVPTETEDEIWETIDINIKMKTDNPRPAIFIPMPATKLTDMAIDLGYLDKMSFDDVPGGVNVMNPTMLKGFDADRVQMLYYLFQTAVALPWARPLIKKMTGLKPNFIFATWFKILYAWQHRKLEGRNFFRYLKYAWNNRKYV